MQNVENNNKLLAFLFTYDLSYTLWGFFPPDHHNRQLQTLCQAAQCLTSTCISLKNISLRSHGLNFNVWTAAAEQK